MKPRLQIGDIIKYESWNFNTHKKEVVIAIITKIIFVKITQRNIPHYRIFRNDGLIINGYYQNSTEEIIYRV